MGDDENDPGGIHPDNIPEREPDHYCNAKCTRTGDDGHLIFTGYCKARAGKGTINLGDGRCWLHRHDD